MCIIVGILFVIPEQPTVEVIDPETGEISIVHRGHGFTHPEYSTMSVGGPGAERHDHILWLGWALGSLICIFFVGCLAFGARKEDKVGAIAKPLFIGGIAYVGVWTMMFVTYRNYMNGDTEGRFLLLPIPTAWMIYGVWLLPAFFIINYIFAFNRQFWNDDLHKKFDAILERSRNRDNGDSV